ncbi:MAG: MerR family transcriptional regulator [Comamonadaceae bacterium]|jgi:DNA-binding transcriptional MerR regulator|uniref:MerR family transcriptional regulator n=1 Tax=Hydrogenophaga borbori TaxID=2294117 RepID=A0A372EP00_9BURK|nr:MULTISPECIES: MerR family transcriptional regulator [Hydrogenophaga]NCT99273.1 MerR family transcriptional regulator [Comamonadaceae bacterium]RFP82359.1 MerR family transcriptional regulator [Hydrogenophaga borbori]WQB81927.1 MerR family transcriptional regulator [Hydrogenophaga sp. SNF1]
MEKSLPPIPAKRYFTIGEVGELCGVKPHVLRYWEQEFTQLRPMKRRGNRRYYQHHEVLMIRRIRELLYDQGFTISGARNKLQELAQAEREKRRQDDDDPIDVIDLDAVIHDDDTTVVSAVVSPAAPAASAEPTLLSDMRRELLEIRELLRLSA